VNVIPGLAGNPVPIQQTSMFRTPLDIGFRWHDVLCCLLAKSI